MNIKEFSELVKFSTHTLRYYEKIGLLKNITRDSSGHRDFTHSDVKWLSFIKRAKETGMSLKTIQQYAELMNQGDSTIETRLQMLTAHTLEVEERIKNESNHLKKLKEKILFYEQKISG